MVKKISLTFISLVILIAGIIAFNNLHYWERSVEIFKINSGQNEGRNFEGRHGDFDRRGRRDRIEGERDGRERSDFRNLPDSIRERIISKGEIPVLPDSIRQRRPNSSQGNEVRSVNENNFRDRRHGGSRGGQKINLGNVGLFLAVFALFTVITIYFDKAFNKIRKRKKNKIRLKK